MTLTGPGVLPQGFLRKNPSLSAKFLEMTLTGQGVLPQGFLRKNPSLSAKLTLHKNGGRSIEQPPFFEWKMLKSPLLRAKKESQF